MLIRNKYAVESIAFLSYMLFAMAWVGCNANLPEIMDAMNVNSLAKGSLLSGSVAFAKIIGTFIAAGIAMTVGIKTAFFASAIMIALGIMTPYAPNYELLLSSRFIMGLAGALMIVYFNPIVLKWFNTKERPIINGINAVAFNVGSTIALWLIDDLNILLGGWQNTLVAFSTASLILAILWLLVDYSEEPQQKTVNNRETSSLEHYGYQQGLTDPFIWRFSIAYSGILSLYLCLITFSSNAGISQTKWVMGLGIIGSAVGMIYSQYVQSRIPIIRWSGLGVIIATIGLLFGGSDLTKNVSGMGLGFFMFLPVAALITIPQEIPKMTGQRITVIFSLFYFISYLISTISLWVFGQIVDRNNGEFSSAFVFTTILSASLFIGSFFLTETTSESTIEGNKRAISETG